MKEIIRKGAGVFEKGKGTNPFGKGQRMYKPNLNLVSLFRHYRRPVTRQIRLGCNITSLANKHHVES